jgi:hypothetical protein
MTGPSPYWIRERFDLWVAVYDIMRHDRIVGTTPWRDEAQRILLEMNALWCRQ